MLRVHLLMDLKLTNLRQLKIYAGLVLITLFITNDPFLTVMFHLFQYNIN